MGYVVSGRIDEGGSGEDTRCCDCDCGGAAIMHASVSASFEPDEDGVLAVYRSGGQEMIMRYSWRKFRKSVLAGIALLELAPHIPQ